jgi:1,4-dihydroxy-2-naphthoate octaprenyltransferase
MYAIGAFGAGVSTAAEYMIGQAMVTAAQLTAHFVNEYADLDVDQHVSNRTLFSGGSGVLARDELAPRVALRAAQTTSIVTVVLSIVVAQISTSAAIVGPVALAVSWIYSMPPVRLLETGWGELATSVVVTVAVPVVGALVQGGQVGRNLFWKMAALFGVHVAMMLAFELPNLESDRAAGKNVIAVRLGLAKTRRLIATLLWISALIIIAAVSIGGLGDGVWWALGSAAIPGTVVVWAMRGEGYQTLTISAVATLVALGTGLLLTS